MKALAALERFLFTASRWKLITAVLLVLVFKTGIWPIPNLPLSRQVALDPFVNPFTNEHHHYLWWNWLSSFIAWCAGANGPGSFFFLHLAMSCAFLATFIWTLFARLDDRDARVALIAFAVLPVSGEALYWVSYDSLTLLLMALALTVPRQLIMTAAIGVALGMQHFEQSTVAACAVIFSAIVARKMDGDPPTYSLRWASVLLLGILLGKAALLGIAQYANIAVNSGRPYWLQEHLPMLLEMFFLHVHVILFASLGIGWALAIRYADHGIRAVPMLLSLAGLLLLLPISGDQTRVFAMVSFLLVATHWLLNPQFLSMITNRAAAALALAGLLLPWSWVWGGVARHSTFPYDVALVLFYLGIWPRLPPPNLYLWPF